jgi:hypothetical protein
MLITMLTPCLSPRLPTVQDFSTPTFDTSALPQYKRDFHNKVTRIREKNVAPQGECAFTVARQELFKSTFFEVSRRKPSELKRKLKITFVGEEGRFRRPSPRRPSSVVPSPVVPSSRRLPPVACRPSPVACRPSPVARARDFGRCTLHVGCCTADGARRMLHGAPCPIILALHIRF